MSENKERLFIKKLRISNCGRYYGEGHTISFSDSSDKNITVVVGLSGRGKSTIFDLIYWCFYGKFRNNEEEKIKDVDYGLVNDDALENLTKDESVTASVVITLHDNDGEKYSITRELKAVRNKDSEFTKFEPLNNSRVSSGIDFETSVKMRYTDDTGDTQIETRPKNIENRINRYFPIPLSDFFLFDGENLIKFRSHGKSSEFIKNGITKISGLDVVSYLIKNSKETADNIQKVIGGKSAQAKPFQDIVNRLNKEITRTKNNIDSNTIQRNKINTLRDELIRIMAKHKSIKELVAEQKKIEISIKNIKRDIKNNNLEFKDFIFENIPYLLMMKTLDNTEKIFTQLEYEDKIPPSISSNAIDKILNSNPLRCVCGREFEKNDVEGEPWYILNQMKKTIIADDLSQGISLGRNLLSQIMDKTQTQKLKNAFNNFTINRNNKRTELNQLNEEYENLDRKIKETSFIIEHDDDPLSKKKAYSEQIEELTGDIKQDEIKLEELEHDKTINSKKLNIALDKEGKYQLEQNKIVLGRAVSKFSQKLEKRIEEILIEHTERTTNKYFLKSAPEKETFDHVNISPNYDITARDKKDKIPMLSKGQAHVLGLSYVAGIREITSTNVFLVIDSPLHNISGVARNDIAKVYSQYLPGIQIILLVTDTEYLQGDSKGAKPVQTILQEEGNIGKEYEIKSTITDEGIPSRNIVEMN